MSQTLQNFEQITGNRPDGSMARGLHRHVISGVGASYSLSQKESGALCLFDRAAGVVYTLPTPVEGMYFDFEVTTTITSNAAKVITKTIASEFIQGAVQLIIAASATTLGAAANGSTHVSISQNGTTTGGIIGSRFRLTAVSATKWSISGIVVGSGSIATPFATS